MEIANDSSADLTRTDGQEALSQSAHQESEPTSGSFLLKIERHFLASAEVVFDAWLDPANVGKWLFATPDGVMVRVDIDAREGGGFTIIEQRGEVKAEHFGKYVIIDRPRRLDFLFCTSIEDKPSLVMIEIQSLADGCLLTMTHQIDAKWAAFRDRAHAGWSMILGNLSAIICQ